MRRPWKQPARTARILALVIVVSAFGCPGDDELGLYCSLMSLVSGSDFDFESCYDYSPGEFDEYRVYLDDVRAYQGLIANKSIAGPGVPSFDSFMTARYPDWPATADALRARIRPAVPGTDSTAIAH